MIGRRSYGLRSTAALVCCLAFVLSALTATAQAQPAATQPAATQPAATQPAATQPAATQPAATQPAAFEETPSGLRDRVEEAGEGEAIEPGQFAVVQYTGRLADGTVFDTSRNRGQPFIFELGAGQVIRGWDQGVEGMQVGEQRTLVVPPDLGYGDTGFPPRIPGGATLEFDVELVDILPGLTVETTEAGEGEPAMGGDFVKVHYTGRLEDGTEFDSSRDGDPLDLPLGAGRVIPGWDLGLEGLKPGGKRTLTIGPMLGYGPRGAPPAIPPMATLIFDVELVSRQPGIEIEVLEEGEGPAAEFGDIVQAKLKVTRDGEQVIVDQQEAQRVPLQRALEPRGIGLSIRGMKVGEKRKATIPAVWTIVEGAPRARENLTVEIELVDIEDEPGESDASSDADSAS